MLLISKEQKQTDLFSERLKILMGNSSFTDFSKKTGLPRTTLNSYANNQTSPTLEKLAKIAETTGASVEWLASGELPNEDMISVPQYDLRVSAGYGAYVEMENPIAEFKFHVDWLRMQGLHGKKLSIVPVMGDSMEPTLYDGDLILIRHDESKDGICVLRVNGEVLVKRIQHDFADNSYLITSDNERYKPIQLTSEFKGDFAIVGQVVRVLQRVKQHDTKF